MIPDGLSITLVEPHYPVNLGHAARLMKNFGVEKLYLVNPKVDFSVAAMYASHAAEVLDNAKVTTFETVREENDLLVATTAVPATKKSNIIRRVMKPENVRELLETAKSSSLVFGRDTTGLTNREIGLCDVTTTIDTSPSYRALNLGHAIAIILYLTWKGPSRKFARQSRMARGVFSDSFYDLAVASRLQSHKVKNLREVGKRIAATSGLSDKQLQLMTGIFRKAVQQIGDGQDADSNT